MSDKWTDKVRGKLSGYEAPAPDGLWEDIIARVETPRVVPVWKRVLKYGTYPVAATVLALIGYLIFMRPDVVNTADDTPIVAEWKTPEDIEDPMVYDEGEDVGESIAPVEMIASRHTKTSEIASPSIEEKKAKTTIESEKEAVSTSSDATESVDNDESPEVETHEPIILRTLPESRQRLTMTPRAYKGRIGQLTMGLYASNLPTKGATTHLGYGSHFPESVQGIANEAMGETRSFLKEEIRELNSVQETKITTERSMPIRLGFSLSYYITNRLAIESGLTATRMSTKVTAGTMQYRTQTEYQIFLIGLPLGLKYNIWESNHFGIYASVGGALEGRITSHATTEYSLDATIVKDPRVEEKKGGTRLLWSLRGAAGFIYSINPQVGLYLEPGVSYYLDKQILNETTYLSSPWVPSVTLGVNVSF